MPEEIRIDDKYTATVYEDGVIIFLEHGELWRSTNAEDNPTLAMLRTIKDLRERQASIGLHLEACIVYLERNYSTLKRKEAMGSV